LEASTNGQIRSSFSFPNRTSLTEEVTQYIVSLVENGEIKPGEKLPSERELSQQLSMSRSCVREALQALSMMRLIDIRPGRGAYVRSTLPEEVIDSNVLSRLIEGDSLRELAEARRILEVEIARLAAVRRTEDDLQELQRSLAVAKSENTSVAQLIASDLNFHLQIAKATHNEVLLKVFSTIFPLLGESRARVHDFAGARQNILEFHRVICEAIEKRDASTASTTMAQHLEQLWHDAATPQVLSGESDFLPA
jgi:GntR family transcriptional regulator, transcriptional repressor for pyruvate dehydrogenase complex